MDPQPTSARTTREGLRVRDRASSTRQGDYKSGWQLRGEEEKEKLRREQKCVEIMTGGAEKDEDEEEDDGLPFACHICRLPFKSPVVTR